MPRTPELPLGARCSASSIAFASARHVGQSGAVFEDTQSIAEDERLRVLTEEHCWAAGTSRRLDSGKFVALADVASEARRAHPEGLPNSQIAVFTGLIHQLLNSAAGRHRDFKHLASLEYVLDAALFYSYLQITLMNPTMRDARFEPAFAEFFSAADEDV